MLRRVIVYILFFSFNNSIAQITVNGVILDFQTKLPIWGATVYEIKTKNGVISDSSGRFNIILETITSSKISVSAIGYKKQVINVFNEKNLELFLIEDISQIEEVVITGTMKEMTKSDSPVPIDIISAKFLSKNPTSNIFDALQNINGVRPQINCNICNTGDIHINGLEGPYTMVLIDGMPIVSALGSVYGLSGIPNSLIERVELVKGPASTLYGSEAVGGLLNIITKNPKNSPKLSVDIFGTSWKEVNIDLSSKINLKNASAIIGINYFNYNNLIDKNTDNFTDLTLQNRISVFNKWVYGKKKSGTIALRYFYEDRWGGELNWSRAYRGSNVYYGESIYTKRFELIGKNEISNNISFQYSYINHNQNSYYGTTPFFASQSVAFSQFLYQSKIRHHDLLVGLPLRYTIYDDNTPATAIADINKPNKVLLPGLFVQDGWKINEKFYLLSGMRVDHNNTHGWISSPRLALKYNSFNNINVLRLNVGKGYRVVNLFTEEHAALTGARKVEIVGTLKPEKSWNFNLNYVRKIILNKAFIGLDASMFYTYFSNKIFPDYTTDVNKIIYRNTNGYVVSKGIALNTEFNHASGLKINAGFTLLNVNNIDGNQKARPLLTEKSTGTFVASLPMFKNKLSVDYTANFTGSMLLPTLGDTDPRPSESPWFSIHNIQLTYNISKKTELYGGVKNIFNFLPYKNLPFLLARSHDPFDKNVVFGAAGQAVANSDNPYGLTFDPSYVYASQQGIRTFLGFRFKLQ